MKKYFSGEFLYGDDFTDAEIEKWYNDEKEAYAKLGSNDKENYHYYLTKLDAKYFFNKLPKNIKYKNVLGVGSAYGHEFLQISSQIENLYILEPSDTLISNSIDKIIPKYIKPTIKGNLSFADNTFDLIVCFSVLHHIPNVSYIIQELTRTLAPGGVLLIREPIHSMGDWTKSREGLTKHERGIPLSIFRKNIATLNLKVINESFGFCMTSFFQRKLGRFLNKNITEYTIYLTIDNFLSNLFKWNIKYHASNMLDRICPTSVFYILKK